ncbi:MAG: DUF4920 domain-containing protein [Chitinophagaceae bacterium]|nr:DUF4920 domain-containing protein [Chitinophagaceae bacterium]
MKQFLSLMAALLITSIAMAQPPQGPAEAGMTFGEKVSKDGAFSVDELGNKMGKAASMEVKITGKVSEVCTKEGCWIRVATKDGNMMVKMKDHKFLVPVSLNGKEVVIAGVAEQKVTTVEQLRHYAEDAGKSKAEIEAIKAPKKEIVVQAKGLLVL